MKLILNGGGIGKQVETSRRLLNDIIDHNKKILFIPFAKPAIRYNEFLEFIINELSDVSKLGIEMVYTPDELLSKNFNDYSCIYIGGGNTYKLLHDLKLGGNIEKIKNYLIEENGIVYGCSAGAIIFGRDLDSCNTDDKNEIGLIDNTGFNMINGYSLLCHYPSKDSSKNDIRKKYLLQLSKQKPIYAIPEEDTIYIDNENIRFIGTKEYYEFVDGIDNLKEIEKTKLLK